MVVNFLQTGEALPTRGCEQAENRRLANDMLPKREWESLNSHCTALFRAAKAAPSNVLCMFHLKQSGCCAGDKCPFAHVGSREGPATRDCAPVLQPRVV